MAISPSHTVLEETTTLRQQLLDHPIYERVSDVESVRLFMQHHAFAVWDFMSLLKRLQLDLCCCTVPWLPPKYPNLARFINEIVLGEESDVSQSGEDHVSHFDLYRAAMDDISADATAVDEFIAALHSGTDVAAAITGSKATDFVGSFVNFNCGLAATGQTHEVAAAFCFGREDIIPDMFERLLKSITSNELPLPALQYYVERHIEMDGDHHGPLSRQLIDVVVGDDKQKLDETIQAAADAIRHRIKLWDGICTELPTYSAA
jgi:hypothetical protein